MSLLDALNHLNETDKRLELDEREIRDTHFTKNGIDEQAEINVNGIKPELGNKGTTKEDQDYLRNESNFLADLLDPSLTPTAQDIEKKIKNFAKKSESEYLKSRLKIHSIEPEKYHEYMKAYSTQHRNYNQSTNISGDQYNNSDDTDSNDENIFTLSSWQDEIVEGQNIDIKSLQSEYLDIKSKEFTKANTRIPIFSNNFIKKIVSHCISKNPDKTLNMKFWTPSLIQYLIEKNFLSNSYVKGGIVKAFIERKSWGLLKLAIIHVSDIPEKDLVYLLKHLISSSSSSSSSSEKSTSNSSSSSLIKERSKPSIEEYFALIICAPRSDAKMMEGLKHLNEDELFYIVQILCKWIEKYDRVDITPEIISVEAHGFSSKQAAVLKKINLPDFHFVIDFMSLIFDIHFPTLIISKKIHPLLAHLSNLITYELAIYESLESMRGCLELFHQKHKEVERKRKSKNNFSTNSARDFRKNSDWLNDGDVPIYSVELFSFYGENGENENNNYSFDIDGNETNEYIESDSDDGTNKEEFMPDIV